MVQLDTKKKVLIWTHDGNTEREFAVLKQINVQYFISALVKVGKNEELIITLLHLKECNAGER